MRSAESRVILTIRAAMDNTPVRLRSLLGMRDWGAEVNVAIRDGRVQSVSGIVLVEGRTRWIGHEWKSVNAMPERRIQTRAFVVDSAHLEMANNDGDLTRDIFTQRASDEEVQISRKFNAACLTSIRGCEGLCDFVPSTLEYLKRHPDAAGSIIPPKCPE